MKKTVFYKKVGRRYQPVSEYDQDLKDSFGKGTHMVQVYPGGQSRRYNIDPDYAALIAAGRVAEDAISKTIMEKSALRIPERQQPITPEQAEAWRKLSELFGDERYALEWCSYREAAEAGVKAMMEEADKLMTNPTIRKSFERFVMLCELTRERQKHE
jgi:hypothetical protein